MATTGRSGTEPGCRPAASTSPIQGTPPRPGRWPARTVAKPCYAAAMAERNAAALQPQGPSYSCRASVASGLANHHPSTSVGRRPPCPKAGARWIA